MTGTTQHENTSESNNNLPDDTGLAGTAVSVHRLDGTTEPGIVRGTCDVTADGESKATRVIVEVTNSEQLLDTDESRVEVV